MECENEIIFFKGDTVLAILVQTICIEKKSEVVMSDMNTEF